MGRLRNIVNQVFTSYPIKEGDSQCADNSNIDSMKSESNFSIDFSNSFV